MTLRMLALVGALAAPSVISAHPFDATYYSSRAAIKADAEGLHVLVVVEVPTAMILEEFLTLYGDPTQLDEEANEIFRRRQFEKLTKDLYLRINKKRAAGTWQPVDSEANGRGTETFFVYLLEFKHEDPKAVAELESLDIRLDMEVFSRDLIYLSASAEGYGPWKVTKNSAEPILEVSSDELYDPETGRWSIDPRLRRLRFQLERSDDPDPNSSRPNVSRPGASGSSPDPPSSPLSSKPLTLSTPTRTYSNPRSMPHGP